MQTAKNQVADYAFEKKRTKAGINPGKDFAIQTYMKKLNLVEKQLKKAKDVK